MKNGIFSSGIASPFKKWNVTTPPTIPRTASPRVHSRPINISFATHARFNPLTPEPPVTARTRLHCFKKL